MHFLEEAPLGGKLVLLRINADVPLAGKKKDIVDDFRLRQTLPTLHYLLDYQAKVIVLAHLGRPGGKIERDLSLRPVYLYLSALLKRPIKFAPSLFSSSTKAAVAGLKEGEVLALENLRFDPGEEANSRTFASKLAKYGDLYVNEAFSVSHRESASLVSIADLLPSYGGLLLEREVELLSGLMRHPEKPYVAVVGGAKISDKLPAIKRFTRQADLILTGGGVANTLLAATGVDVKKSLVDEQSLEDAKQILKLARGKLVVPEDFVWHQGAILDIGPKTQERYRRFLRGAGTAFWSGPMGKVEQKPYRAGSLAVAKALDASGATTVVGGGDTVGFINQEEMASQFSFVSTGGSATLEFLGGTVLPGLRALDR
jgi:3-phosphoglycerate kinase